MNAAFFCEFPIYERRNDKKQISAFCQIFHAMKYGADAVGVLHHFCPIFNLA
jgi:hypothetical protein